jgi:hypothetical protein
VNPIERVWQELRANLAWLRLAHVELLEDELIAQLARYPAAALQSLMYYRSSSRPSTTCLRGCHDRLVVVAYYYHSVRLQIVL